MGFPCIAVGVAKSLVTLLHLLNYTKYVVSKFQVLFFYFYFYPGMLDPSELAYDYLHESPSSIKSRLPVVEFSDFFSSSSSFKGSSSCDQQQPALLCAVCLMELEAAHEVRELGNCSHAFHKGCIDKWLDIGSATCPLCRAQILPKGIGGDQMDALDHF